MLELVAVETGEVEMVNFFPESEELAQLEWIVEQNDERVAEGADAVDYRIVKADTRNCPDRTHGATEHATVCLADEWIWENLGQ
jgi:hypothetical protein